jgi:hypothetical protein
VASASIRLLENKKDDWRHGCFLSAGLPALLPERVERVKRVHERVLERDFELAQQAIVDRI